VRACIPLLVLLALATMASVARADEHTPSLGELYEAVRPSVVRIHGRDAAGTGFAVEGGRVATAWHVVSRGGDLVLETLDGRMVRARVFAFDRDADVALLTPESPLGVEPLPTRAQPPRVGETLITVGHPLVSGAAPEGERTGLLVWSLTAGIVSAVGERQVQATTSFQPGNSGGPALDVSGAVVGVVVQRQGDFGIATRPEPLLALMELDAPRPPKAPVSIRPNISLGVDLLPGARSGRRDLYGFGGGVDLQIDRRLVVVLRGRASWLLGAEPRALGELGRRFEVLAGGGVHLDLPFQPGRPAMPAFVPRLVGGVTVVERGAVEDRIRLDDPDCVPQDEPCAYDSTREVDWSRRTLPLMGVGLAIGWDFLQLDLALATAPNEPLEQLRVRLGISFGRSLP
jgi:hypothetical protein